MTWLTHQQWVPITAPLSSGTACRSPELLIAIIEQFQVDKSPRYRVTDARTWCNIFVWDVTRALGCELPHWWMSSELTVNALQGWLNRSGEQHGWRYVGEDVARTNASRGCPAIAIWENPGGPPGHIAMLVPPDDEGATQIAQAGRHNFVRGKLSLGFGTRPVKFYAHA